MNTTALDAAYRDLLQAAEAINGPEAGADVDWTLSHIALSDRLLAAAVQVTLEHQETIVDNREAMDGDAIAALIAETSHAERVELVRRNAAELAAVLQRISGSKEVVLRIVGRDGRRAPDQRLTWADLVELRANAHIPGHAARLRALAGGAESRAQP